MQLTPEQVKGRIKNAAKENKADARTLMRIYMMERFLERVANSQYKDNFIIKGGMLVTAMVGVALRSTMDIDTSIKNQKQSRKSEKSGAAEPAGGHIRKTERRKSDGVGTPYEKSGKSCSRNRKGRIDLHV